jgi:hypothetical protein
VLVIDDLRWTDSATVTLWGRLARLAPQNALLLIGISRPMPQRDDLAKLRRAQNDAIRRAVGAYRSLGAAADVNRVQAAFREQGMRLGSHARQPQGPVRLGTP